MHFCVFLYSFDIIMNEYDNYWIHTSQGVSPPHLCFLLRHASPSANKYKRLRQNKYLQATLFLSFKLKCFAGSPLPNGWGRRPGGWTMGEEGEVGPSMCFPMRGNWTSNRKDIGELFNQEGWRGFVILSCCYWSGSERRYSYYSWMSLHLYTLLCNQSLSHVPSIIISKDNKLTGSCDWHKTKEGLESVSLSGQLYCLPSGRWIDR